MADIDEAVQPTELDTVDDEVQDFRLLSISQSKIPRRGEKDFEQHGLQSQDAELAAARHAMSEALSVPRVHRPGALKASFDPTTSICCIPEPRGSNLHNLGRNDSQGRLFLLPEEALYLLERASLLIEYTDSCLPLSLESAYAHFVGSQGLTSERFSIYAALKRSGYIVQRAPSWHGEQLPILPAPSHTFFKFFPFSSSSGSILQPGLYHSYAAIYKKLQFIPHFDPAQPHEIKPPQSYLQPCWYVWKPTPSFRKTAPPSPDYQICVLDADKDAVPSLTQVEDLMQRMPYDPPPENTRGKTYVRLRHGYRKCIIAVVQHGLISYVSLTDSGFVREPVYNRRIQHGKGRSNR